jgi:hypothetical protein
VQRCALCVLSRGSIPGVKETLPTSTGIWWPWHLKSTNDIMQQRGGAASHQFLRAALMTPFDVVHCILPLSDTDRKALLPHW